MEAEEAAESQARIYIGGLGEGVTADDLRKILSAIGDVRDVDIIRTKGRSFAYVDFRPASLNSIPKLFSTYNGCAWKGGRLRLEKAKEHYLDRLNREREEAAQPELESEDHEEAVVEPLEKNHLRIFFPRLRKGKSLPLSGTGKHRYSFQRVEPPLVPLHFCDCEEHSFPSETVVAKQTDHQEENEFIIDDAEINVMNSVMNRLFERERIVHDTGRNSYSSIQNQVLHLKADVGSIHSNMVSAAESRSTSAGSNRNKRLRGAQNYGEGATQLASEALENGALSHSKKKKLHVVEEGNGKEVESVMPEGKEVSHHEDESKQESEESETDDDGLILNVLSAANNSIGLSRSNKKDPPSFNPEPSQDVHKERTKTILPPKKEKKSPFGDERDGSKFMSISYGNKGNAEKHTGGPAQSLKESDVRHSWSQKSSWRALVGDKGISAFSLSSILPDSDASNREQGLSNNVEAGSHTNTKELEPFAEEVLKKSSRSSNKKRKSAKDGSDGNETMHPRKKGNLEENSHGFDTTAVTQRCGLEFNPGDSDPKTPRDNNVLNQSSSLPFDNPASEGETLYSNPKPNNSTDSELTESKSMKHTKPSGEYGRGSSWLHQSTWVQLVSENASFSLSGILPGSSATQELRKPNEDVLKPTGDIDNTGMNFWNKRSGDASTADGFIQEPYTVQAVPETNEQTVANHNDFNASVLEKNNSATEKASARDSGSGETCLFMRNAASVKEWVKFKAALRGSNKKRNKQQEE